MVLQASQDILRFKRASGWMKPRGHRTRPAVHQGPPAIAAKAARIVLWSAPRSR